MGVTVLICLCVAVAAGCGVYDLQQWLEQWDHRRHAGD